MKLECKESPLEQSTDERIAYTITTTNWVSSPTNTSVAVYDETDNDTVVTGTVLPDNTPTESGDVISLDVLRELTKGHSYRIEVQFTVSGSVYECFFRVSCVR